MSEPPPSEETTGQDDAGYSPQVHYYYVDEAGDPILFNARGAIIVGTQGCSRFFILGKVEVAEPDALATALTDLRLRLLQDPYFRGVPSMDPARRKTAAALHAKDDVPEVRREVFRLLQQWDLRFYAYIRDKHVIVRKIVERNRAGPSYHYKPNHLYDRCVPALFQDRLHQHSSYRIVFAQRGSSDRTAAFRAGLQQAKERFRRKWGIEGVAPIEVVSSTPARTVCLQATDYFLWALQRCFERGERRYLDLLWPKVGLILDRDDTRHSGAGAYYTQKNALPPGFEARLEHGLPGTAQE